MATVLARNLAVPSFVPPPALQRSKRGEDPFIALLAHFQATVAWMDAADERGDLASDEGFEHYTDTVIRAEQKIARTPGRTTFSAYAKLYCAICYGEGGGPSKTDQMQLRTAFDALAAALDLPGYEASRRPSTKVEG